MAVPPNKLRTPAGTDANEIRFKNFGAGVKQYSNYGPTSSTGYWNGITPPTGGYTIYSKKTSQGPAIFTAGNDQNLIYFTKLLGGSNITDATTALSYLRSDANTICVNFDYPDIVTDGLIYCIDNGFTVSYPQAGKDCFDLSHNNLNTSFVGDAIFDYGVGGFIRFDGASNLSSGTLNPINISIGAWVRTGDPDANGYIVVKEGLSSEIPWVLSIGGGVNSPASDGMSLYTGSAWLSSGIKTNVRDGGWHYVMGTYDGTSMKYYVDGFLDSSTTDGNGDLVTASTKFYISVLNSTSEYFIGDIVMVHIYDRALSDNEVYHNYINTNPRFSYNYSPDALAWNNIQYNNFDQTYTYSTQRVTGISTSIYIRSDYFSISGAKLFYRIDQSLVTFSGSISPSLQGFTQLDSLVNFSVPEGSYVTFGCEGTTSDIFLVSIYNSSDSGGILNQFTVNILA